MKNKDLATKLIEDETTPIEDDPGGEYVNTIEDEELLDKYIDENDLYRNEGDRGMENLEKIVGVLGYTGTGFRFGNPIEQFLSDNPGAIEAIMQFIGEWVPRNKEWADSLRSELKSDLKNDGEK